MQALTLLTAMTEAGGEVAPDCGASCCVTMICDGCDVCAKTQTLLAS